MLVSTLMWALPSTGHSATVSAPAPPAPAPPAPTPSKANGSAQRPVPPGFIAGKSTEIVAERNETTKFFRNPDGSKNAQIANGPVHYKDATGVWADIDNALVPDPARPGVVRNRANAWSATFAPLPEGVTVTGEDGPVRVSPAGAAAVSPVVEPGGTAVVYPEAWPGVDLRYQVENDKVKEDVILKRHPKRNNFDFATGGKSFAPDPEQPGGLVPAGGLAKGKAAEGSKKLRLAPAEVLDKQGTPQPEARPSLVPTGSGPGAGLRLSVDAAWLKALSPDAYPISLDPTFAMGSSATWAYKSDGFACAGCGNREGNSRDRYSWGVVDRYWRSVNYFDYSPVFGQPIQAASVYVGWRAAGTANAYPFHVFHATNWGFNSLGQYFASNNYVGNDGWVGSEALRAAYDYWARNRIGGQALTFAGHEVGGLYTYKQFNYFTLSLTYWDGNPFGSFDAGTGMPDNKMRVSGWAIDPDTAAPIDVHTYVDGAFAGATRADQARPDVGNAYPGYGPNHGFNTAISTTPGTHNVCTYAINVGYGNANIFLGCRSVTVGGSPFGYLQQVTTGPGRVRVPGWAIDPDTTGPIPVHVYVDGAGTAISANKYRTDVAGAYPDHGAYHGFEDTIPAAGGTHTICAYGINIAGPGNNALLQGACQTLSIPFGLPEAPTDVRSTSASGQATATWTPPRFDGGSPITAYRVSAVDEDGGMVAGEVTVCGTCTNATLSGLTDGHNYALTVTAQTSIGSSPAATSPHTRPGFEPCGSADSCEFGLSDPGFLRTALGFESSSPDNVKVTIGSLGISPLNLHLESGQGESTVAFTPLAGGVGLGPIAQPFSDTLLTLALDGSWERRMFADVSGVAVEDTIKSLSAPTEYSQAVSLPSGWSLRIEQDGDVSILDHAGDIVGHVSAAVATDANGADVPVQTSVIGNVVKSEVLHRSASYSYPIVVDPYLYMGGALQGAGQGPQGREYYAWRSDRRYLHHGHIEYPCENGSCSAEPRFVEDAEVRVNLRQTLNGRQVRNVLSVVLAPRPPGYDNRMALKVEFRCRVNIRGAPDRNCPDEASSFKFDNRGREGDWRDRYDNPDIRTGSQNHAIAPDIRLPNLPSGSRGERYFYEIYVRPYVPDGPNGALTPSAFGQYRSYDVTCLTRETNPCYFDERVAPGSGR